MAAKTQEKQSKPSHAGCGADPIHPDIADGDDWKDAGEPEATLILARAYQERKILTPKYHDDGLHIALATGAEVDVLVSWNFKHIVHFNKIRLFNSVNLEHGYKQLQIYSPREVASHEK